MDFEKEYKSLVGRITKAYLYAQTDSTRAVLEDIYPSLSESEDERIRQELIGGLMRQRDNFGASPHDNNIILPGFTMKVGNIIAYLEKQKEQKPADDKAFEEWIDDWWKHNKVNNPHSYDNGDEIQFDERGFKNFCRGIRNMYQQKPAEWSDEDSDNLERVDNYLWMLDDYVGDDCAMPQGKTDKIRGNIQGILSPWLKSLPQRFNIQPKQEWSEEDKKRIKQLIYDTEFIKAGYEKKKEQLGERFNDVLIKDCDEQIAWLKSLPLNLKKKNEDVAKLCSNEWNEEDEKMLQHIVSDLREFRDCETDEELISDYEDEIAWLKSLRPSWKPSEEQMRALEECGECKRCVKELYEQLKKLI